LPSVFEILKPAVGPSSSHTLGPMLAARAFLDEAVRAAARAGISRGRIRIELYGSLALTGRGHLTDAAIAAGLTGLGPRDLGAAGLDDVAQAVREAGHIPADGMEFAFDMDRDLAFDATRGGLSHPNTMRFALLGPKGGEVVAETYASIGGGRLAGGSFGPLPTGTSQKPRVSASATIELCAAHGIDLVEHAYRTEETDHGHTRAEVDAHLDLMWSLMTRAIERGLAAEGVLPGSLRVERRARALYGRFSERMPRAHVLSPEASLASIYAIAVAEENAAGGSVVTAPTCGACGVVPACLRLLQEREDLGPSAIRGALLVAGWIGAVIATNASISGAEVGCQGEVGAASAMAAAAVAHLFGASVHDQVDRAAESALEHYLGLTCDPVAGLVQIPCIERNAAGAVSALNAAGLALISGGADHVSFDDVVDAMWRTGRDLDARYRETAQGGLAAQRSPDTLLR
jgi:L-serine dehydratase